MELAEKLLSVLDGEGSLDSYEYAGSLGLDHQKVVGAIKSLEALEGMILSEVRSFKVVGLTEEGLKVRKEGSHEALLYAAVPEKDGIPQPDLVKNLSKEIGKIGFSKAMNNGWIVIDKSGGGKPLVKRKVPEITDQIHRDLNIPDLNTLDDKVLAEYKKRKMVHETVIKAYKLTPGPKFSTKIQKQETEITADMMKDGSWKDVQFKPYNFDALGTNPSAGHLHPLMKVRAEYRQIFLEMGFTEMPTNNFVESSFWNFDALFQPQQHPARDAHDTFFISDPAETGDLPMDYLEKVKKIHSSGGFGSIGYRYDWKIEEAKKNLLRTHTTAVSTRMLYKLMAGGQEFRPQKYFSIDRVFRNETLDATHLAEFHQIEGVIADRGLTLGDLIGVLYEFFKKLGIEKLRFKPAYNPYTEPSMEIFSYHEGLKKWVEIGNSGIFRPEMLLPMGIPDDVNVIAWGLSLERPTMIKYGIDNIRDLIGHKMSLKMVEKNPICRLDKNTGNPLNSLIEVTEKRWDDIYKKLDNISSKLKSNFNIKPCQFKSNQKIDVVIKADPLNPPLALKVLLSFLNQSCKIRAQTHIHSNINLLDDDDELKNFLSLNQNWSRSFADVNVSLIWKEIPILSDPVLYISSKITPIHGEANILRYFIRALKTPFEINNKEDFFLDSIHKNLNYETDVSKINKFLKSLPKLPNSPIIGLALWSAAHQRSVCLNSIQSWLIPCLKKDFNLYNLIKSSNNSKVLKL